MKEVYIVNGKRTPQVKSGDIIKDLPVPFLGSGLINYLREETSINPDEVDEVIVGNTGAPAKYPNISRVIALEAGLHKKTSAYSVHRNCASGMEAVSQAYDKIASGRSNVVFAGGVESMSQMPLIFSKEMTELFIELMKSKTCPKKLRRWGAFRFPHLSPVVAIEQGLTDPFCGLNMGETAELLAREMGITREQQDEFANESHRRAVKAQNDGFGMRGYSFAHRRKSRQILTQDIGPRGNSTLESLAKLRPYFERKSGTVTVGNSCPITDGGSMLLMCSGEAVSKYNLDPIAKLHNYHFHGLEPERMGMGPLVAMNGLLKRVNMSLSDIDLIEINEAFAAQVIAVTRASEDAKLAKKFDIEEPMGKLI